MVRCTYEYHTILMSNFSLDDWHPSIKIHRRTLRSLNSVLPLSLVFRPCFHTWTSPFWPYIISVTRKEFKLFHPTRWSVFLLVLGFYLHFSSLQWFLSSPFILFSCYITVFPLHPGIFLPKEKKKRTEKKFSKCLSLYCKLWATVVHSLGTLGNCVVRSRNENSLRGCSLPNKPGYADRVKVI
jgi:hypothetical protein